jgi:hypothetical protein
LGLLWSLERQEEHITRTLDRDRAKDAPQVSAQDVGLIKIEKFGEGTMDNNSWAIKIVALIIYALIIASFGKFYFERSNEQMRQEISNSKEYSQVIALIKENHLSLTKIKTVTENRDYNYWIYFLGIIGSFMMINVPYIFIKSIIQYIFNRKVSPRSR